MKVTKILGSVCAVAVAFVALTATSESKAGDEELLSASCSGGALTVKPSDPAKWHVNTAAPWKWTGGDLDKSKTTEAAAIFKGSACGGTVKAYICSGHDGQGSCKGPISVTVK